MMSKTAASPLEGNSVNDEELPEGWEYVHLSDVAELVSGAGFPEIFQGKKGLQYPFFKVGNLADVKSGSLLLHSAHSIDDKIVKEIHARIIPPNSIIFAKIGMAIRLNRRRMIGVPSCIDNNLMAAVPKDIIIPKFLLRFLETVEFMPLTQATTVPSLRKTDLGMIRIPLPPLAEQQRIVARVEALLSHVDAAGDRLRRVPAIMKQFRQSVLAAACSGKLTEEWREENPDVEPASLLVENIIKSHNSDVKAFGGKAGTPTEGVHDISEVDIPDSWTICELKYLSKPGKPITYGILKPGQDIPNGIPYIRVTDYKNNKLKIESIRHTTPEIAANYKRSILSTDDLLLSIRGTVGRVCQIPQELHGGNITQDSVRISVHDSISREYIELYLQTPSVQKRFENAIKGVAIRGVNVGDVRVLQVVLPPLAEQREIVRRVGLLFERADAIEREVAAAGRRCERLTQAVLGKAFRGELTRNDDEPN